MDAPVDADRIEAWASMAHAHAALTEALEGHLQEDGGLSLAWYEVLARLSTAPERSLRMHDLARSLFLSRSGLTRLVDRMEAAGLVRRRSCPADRRGTFAEMTEEGRRTLEGAAPVFVAALEEHFGRLLSTGDVRALRQGFEKIIEASGRCLRAEAADAGPTAPA